MSNDTAMPDLVSSFTLQKTSVADHEVDDLGAPAAQGAIKRIAFMDHRLRARTPSR